MTDTSRHGDWRALCQRCGFEYWASELRKEWTGLYVCRADYDVRHPQEFVKGRADRQTVPWSSPEPADVFLDANDVTIDNFDHGFGFGFSG